MRRIVCMIALLFVYLPLTADAQDHLDNHSDTFWIAAEEQILATLGYPTGGLLADPAVAHGIEVPRLFTNKHSIAIAAGKYTRGLAETFGIPEEVSDEQLITTMENALLMAVYHRDKMNYDRIATSLVNLHKGHNNPEVKDMALGVLQLIGDNRGLAYVRDVASEDERNHCRHLAVGVVGDYFAAHPVIAGQ
jgi:hypothetical protein